MLGKYIPDASTIERVSGLMSEPSRIGTTKRLGKDYKVVYFNKG